MNPLSGIDRDLLSRRRAPPTLPPARAPLLWLLPGLISGYLLAAASDGIGPLLPALGGAALLFVALSQHRAPLRWTLAFLPATTLLAASWALLWANPRPPVWDTLPPREITAVVTIERVLDSNPYPDRAYAIGRIVEAPAVVAELVGQRVFGSFAQGPEAPELAARASYRVRGVLHPVDRAAEGSFIRWLDARRTYFRLRQGTVLEPVGPMPRGEALRIAWSQRWAAVLLHSPPAQAAQAHLLAAMMLGNRDWLQPAQKEAFLLSGTMHLFAISGLHVMVAALTLRQLCLLLPLPARVRLLLVLALLGLYVLVTGLSPSALRAYSMVVFFGLAGGLRRPARPVPAILASAVVVLLVQPAQLFSAGFQLSYAVVLSILLFGLPLGEWLVARHTPFPFVLAEDLRRWQRAWRGFRRHALQTLVISLAATLGSAPLIVLHFGLWTPGAILLNALLVPLASLVVATGVLMILLASLGLGAVATFFAHGAWLLLWGMEGLVQVAVRLPGFFAERQWHATGLAYGALLGFLLLLFALDDDRWLPRRRPLVRFSVPLLWILAALALGTHSL